MSVLRFDPFGDPFRQMDRLTNQLLSGTRTPMGMPMDVWQADDGFHVSLDLPGVDPSSVDITTERNVLTITAERRPEYQQGSERAGRGAAARKLHAAVAIGRHGGFGERPGDLRRRGPASDAPDHSGCPAAPDSSPPFTDTALGGTPTTARESGGSHSDFTALLVPPAVQKVRPGSDPARFEDDGGRGGIRRGWGSIWSCVTR